MAPRVIYLFGVDGSGKSTLARELVQVLASRGIPARCLWFRFNHWLSRLVNALGHLLGLAHCPDSACIMFFSNTLADTEKKGPGFCPVCSKQVKGILR